MTVIVQYRRLLLQAFAGIAVVCIFYPVFCYEMIRRFIYRAVVTTNKSWSTFFETRLILRRVLFLINSFLFFVNTIANAVCYSHWHYMVWLASLWHWHYSSASLCFSKQRLLWFNTVRLSAGAFFSPPTPPLLFYVLLFFILHRSRGCGRGTFTCFIFLFRMLLIFIPPPSTHFLQSPTHRSCTFGGSRTIYFFCPGTPRLCLLIYFLFFFYFFRRFVYFCTFCSK